MKRTKSLTLTATPQLLARLQAFTADCRLDMHEPDEQDITATVKGKSFDNAYGNEPTYGNEIIVTLKRRLVEPDQDGYRVARLNINLANLIALARLVTLERAATLDVRP